VNIALSSQTRSPLYAGNTSCGEVRFAPIDSFPISSPLIGSTLQTHVTGELNALWLTLSRVLGTPRNSVESPHPARQFITRMMLFDQRGVRVRTPVAQNLSGTRRRPPQKKTSPIFSATSLRQGAIRDKSRPMSRGSGDLPDVPRTALRSGRGRLFHTREASPGGIGMEPPR